MIPSPGDGGRIRASRASAVGSSLNTRLESFFLLSENGTTVRTEIMAGGTTFLTMAYIVFANPLAQEPRSPLLDEPASFLDIRHQVEIYDIVRSLADRERCAVLTVMHDLNLASEYCDRIYLLRSGKIEAQGATAEVFTYANLTRVFETDIYVDTNAITGKLLVIPMSGRARERVGERSRQPDRSPPRRIEE